MGTTSVLVVVFALLAVWHSLTFHQVQVNRDIQSTITELNTRIAGLQVLHSEKFAPGRSWDKQLGLYASEIRRNYNGFPGAALLRDISTIYDNNAFATLWIVTCLMESHTYGTAPAPDPQRLQLAVDAINTFHTKNLPSGEAAMDFWPQVYNKTSGAWVQSPENTLQMLQLLNYFPWNTVKQILSALGLHKLSNDAARMPKEIQVPGCRLRIPPDFDDSFLNLILGAQLLQHKATFPSAYQSWASNNTDLLSLQKYLKSYAYRPLSKDADANTIDPRTYYYMRPFLERAAREGDEIALVTTWLQNISELRQMREKGKCVIMPYNLNNVDVVVAANTVAGITEALLAGLVQPDAWFDEDVQRIYLNTTAMISWAVTSDSISTRPDLVMTYYPSLYNFLWYFSRTLFRLQSNQDRLQGLPACVRDVQQILTTTFRDHVTPKLMSSGQTEGDQKYFDDFLGDGDKDVLGRPKVHGEDRIFSTAQAVNTLLATWTTFNTTSKKLVWIDETQTDVKTVVSQAVSWLEKNALSGKYKPHNAFFSASSKGLSSEPVFFPGNFIQYINGSAVPSVEPSFDSFTDLISGVTGVIDPEEYQKMIGQPHFGMATPTKFDGFNSQEDYFPFPFWSSEPYTYATVMLALAQYDNIA